MSPPHPVDPVDPVEMSPEELHATSGDRMAKAQRFIIPLALCMVCLVTARGLFSGELLAGHDSPAYPVSQHQFHENLRDGVIFPRWAGDMRYGYGHAKLQFRPPALHYLAEPLYATTGEPFASLNITLAILVFAGAFGMYRYVRTLTAPACAGVAAAAYVTGNYLMANLYLRGAYYEVTAMAFMPWILWVNARILQDRAQTTTLLIGALAWVGLLCGHPATAIFFVPVAILQLIVLAGMTRRYSGIACGGFLFGAGLLISAPYWYVALRELAWVRLEIFLTGIDSFHDNFVSVRRLVTDTWPDGYAADREMLGLNGWAVIVMIASPLTWFIGGRTPLANPHEETCVGTDDRHNWAMFFYLGVLGTLAMCLPLSRGVWDSVPVLHTFNFPWRVLGVTAACLAPLLALTLDWILTRLVERPVIKRAAGLALMGLLAALAYSHSGGDRGGPWMTREHVTTEAVRMHAGISSQFYTPRWVKRYAEEPAQESVSVVEGRARVALIDRRPTRWQLRIEAAEESRIAVEHYYYPGWRVHGLPGGTETPDVWSERGLMSFAAPAGNHDVELRFGKTPQRIQGYAMSLGGLALLSGCVVWARRRGHYSGH